METNAEYKTNPQADDDNAHWPVEYLIKQLLYSIGEDPNREGLKDTPRRVARAWDEFMNFNPGNHDTTFEAITTDQMVVVSGLRVWSYCEHHLLPFYADIAIGYIATEKILGLSKFGRIAQKYAHRLQVQERIVDQIARDIMEITDTVDVGVIATGEHLCMTMRGIKMPSKMVSSSMRGLFRSDHNVKQEFLTLAGYH